MGAYLNICKAASLRGHEGFYLNLAELRKHLVSGNDGVVLPGYSKKSDLPEEVLIKLPFVILPLLGKFREKSAPTTT